MGPVIRSIVAVVAGCVVGSILVAAVEYVGHMVYPLPEGVDPYDVEALRAAMANIPAGALLFVLLAWAVGSLGGGWVAGLVARRAHAPHALIVGGLLMAGGVVNMLMLPHPLWFWVVSLLVFLPAAYLGGRLAARA